jgi:hypothetical protein
MPRLVKISWSERSVVGYPLLADLLLGDRLEGIASLLEVATGRFHLENDPNTVVT